MRSLLLTIACTLVCFAIFANNYDDAWKALNKNDRATALIDLKKAMNDPATAVDAYITYMYLLGFEGREKEATDFIPKVYDKLSDPNAYVYALWFNKGVLGNYGKKTPVQQNLLDKIFTDGKCNGSLQSAAHYVESWNDVASNNFSGAYSEADKMGSVGPLWQLVGPFDNLSGSGFDKDYGPLEHPESTAVFKSVNNADIAWFTPTEMNKDGWTFPYAHIRYNTATIFAQTFINSPDDAKVLLNAGFAGSIKVWVNDELVLSEQKELLTELDYLKNYVQLKKGNNRLLVQLSYTDNAFPNFIIRFTDGNMMPFKGLTYTPSYQNYTAVTTQSQLQPSVKHFAESYFENKIQAQPDNLINYILLCDTYLRNKRTADARMVIQKAISKYPDNSLLRFSLMSCYLKDDNNTLLQQETERMKDKDPDCMLASKLNIQQLIQQQKYQEAEDELKKYDTQFNDDEDMLDTKVQLYSSEQKYDTLVSLIESAYTKYPEDPNVVLYMFNVKMNVNKDAKAALGVYENFLKNNFDYDIEKKLAEKYKEQGLADKELEVLNTIAKNFSYDPDLLTDVSGYYYDQQNYAKAAELGKQVLALAPYVSNYWQNLGLELAQQHNSDADAINALKKAIYYNANNYTAREKLRELQNKPSIWKAFPDVDVDKLIHDNPDTIKDYNYYYLLDQKYAVVYPEGACEEYYTYVIKITNDKGIDAWKETTVSYNSNLSDLAIDKAEVVKANGVKTPAEQNDNQLVFTGLEAGDVIVLKYKIQNYYQGRLAHDYWNKFIFNSFVPENISRFSLLIANSKNFNTVTLNTDIKPVKSSYGDDFTLYTWQMQNSPAVDDEAFMPALEDVGASVTVSTINSWGHIAGWYSDLSQQKTNNDYEVTQAYSKLFPKGTNGMSQKTIAETIYDYIEKNIRYSSVSFRQSAYTPQKPSVTINTSLGDCKDLSMLFVALAGMAGIKANLVLVNTRDYGQKTMPLPSVEFNHCIVHTILDGRPYYLELTDNTMPFASLPTSLYKASSLLIPSDSKDTANASLDYIIADNRTPDKIIRNADIKIDSNDMHLDVTLTKTGALTSSLRDAYSSLSMKQQVDKMEKAISGSYSNQVKVSSLAFSNLDSVEDTVHYNCNYVVKDIVSELGDMKVIKIPFEDQVATIDNFSPSNRDYPIEYCRYEDADAYEATFNISIPAGYEFIELPKDQSLNFQGSSYTLQYVKKDDTHLTVVRKAYLKKDNVMPADYTAMKNFLNSIVKAESKYIAFKQQ